MLAFVDESGDAGLKLGKGSSPLFVIVLVVFPTPDEAQACDDRIAALRGELGLADNFEFHFRGNSHRIRLAFLRAVAPFNFTYYGFALNKDPSKLYGQGLRYKESLYKFACRLLFENAAGYLRDTIVVIDESGERRFRDELRRYLRHRIMEADRRIVRKLKMQRSHSNNLLQLADYVAGVTSRSVQGRTGRINMNG